MRYLVEEWRARAATARAASHLNGELRGIALAYCATYEQCANDLEAALLEQRGDEEMDDG